MINQLNANDVVNLLKTYEEPVVMVNICGTRLLPTGNQTPMDAVSNFLTLHLTAVLLKCHIIPPILRCSHGSSGMC